MCQHLTLLALETASIASAMTAERLWLRIAMLHVRCQARAREDIAKQVEQVCWWVCVPHIANCHVGDYLLTCTFRDSFDR
jgi:hypothetical protein